MDLLHQAKDFTKAPQQLRWFPSLFKSDSPAIMPPIRGQHTKKRGDTSRLSSSYKTKSSCQSALFCIVHLQNSNALVKSAVLADLVRSFERTAVAACAHCRCIELPNSRTSFVTSCLGDLILRYSHVLAPPSTFDSRRWFRSDCTRKYRTNPCSPPDKASLSAA